MEIRRQAYTYRKKNGELKSQTMKQKELKYGFATLNNHTIIRFRMVESQDQVKHCKGNKRIYSGYDR